MNNEILLDNPTDETSVATLAPETDDQPRCEKCHAPAKVQGLAACPRCGYYPSLGIYIDVAPWEEELYDPELAAAKPTPSLMEVWGNLIPKWGWLLIATSLAVVVISVAVRLLTPPGSFRTIWSVTQLFVGITLTVLGHVATFVWMLSTEFDMGMTDVLLKPIKIWKRVFVELPRRFWLLNATTASLTAALSAGLIIGGIPYERLWDWGFKAPPKQNLMGAMMSQAQKVKGRDENLEEAVNGFAGNASTDANSQNNPNATPRLTADCVVIGYTPRQEGKAAQLWLASEFGGKLVFVGRVTPQLGSEEMDEFLAKLESSHAPRAFVPAPGEPQWVKPSFTCRVTYIKRDSTGKMVDIVWESLLDEVKLPW